RGVENFGWEGAAYSRLASIKLYTQANPSTVVKEVRLAHDTSQSNRLTLKAIDFYGVNSAASTPGYKFEYAGTVGGTSPNALKIDDFGYFDTVGRGASPYNTNTVDGSSWSLTKMVLPTGGWEEYVYDNDEIAAGENVPY